LKTISKAFDKNYIFIRECYPKLLIRCLALGKEGAVCISGDPGIGKSFFAFYVFLALFEMQQKVVLVSQSGSALVVYGGKKPKFEPEYRGAEWMDPDTWLLLDGRAEDRFLSKRQRGIVFASPKKSNYHEFIKQNGSLLFMPPWKWSEVEQFVRNEGIRGNLEQLLVSWHRRSCGLAEFEDFPGSTEASELHNQGKLFLVFPYSDYKMRCS
jgi:hypothetical protein